MKKRNHIDLPLLTAVLVLMVMSLGIVYSASATWSAEMKGSSSYLLNRQIIKVLLGIVALFAGMFIPHPRYRKLTKFALIAGIGFLALTLVLGGETKGATRWLHLGGFSFQPSEFAKFALLFHLCTLIATKGDLIKDFDRGFRPMMVWIGAVSLLVLLQPNFSAGAMIILLSLVMLFISRARFSHLFISGLAILPALTLYVMLSDYRRARIMSFFQGHTQGKHNYQLSQGIIGFGNGGVFGVGPGESRQRDFFLPESYGDFVFSVIGEEYGLIGTLFFMGLFLFMMLRGFKIAKYAKDDFSRLLALSITSTVTLYALVNAGVTLGILPTTGQPMPFVSYGGSALLFSSFAVGVLLNISTYTDLHPRMPSRDAQAIDPGPEPAVGRVY